MEFDVFIPARYGSTRLPGKPLQQVAGKPIIQWVYEAACVSDASNVVVATDDQRIVEAVQAFGGEVCLTRSDHQSGTDRISEAVRHLQLEPDRIIVNLQGDEPQVPGELLNQTALALAKDSEASMATVAHEIHDESEFDDPNVVKVVFGVDGAALYFSRSKIPFNRGKLDQISIYRHLGIYAYRVVYLNTFTERPASALEKVEALEQLRALEYGDRIAVHLCQYDPGIGIDTAEDLKKFKALMND